MSRQFSFLTIIQILITTTFLCHTMENNLGKQHVLTINENNQHLNPTSALLLSNNTAAVAATSLCCFFDLSINQCTTLYPYDFRDEYSFLLLRASLKVWY